MFAVLLMILLRHLAPEHSVEEGRLPDTSVPADQDSEIGEISVEVSLCQPRIHLGADALEVWPE